jgi:hypothetical protein
MEPRLGLRPDDCRHGEQDGRQILIWSDASSIRSREKPFFGDAGTMALLPQGTENTTFRLIIGCIFEEKQLEVAFNL